MKNVVLVAHSDEDVLKRLVAALEEERFHCLTARDGAEALATASGYGPQLVIAPSELAGLQGTEVCLRLKQDDATAKIAVILIAKSASEEDKFVSDEVGADAYLAEPFEDADLVAKVRELFESEKLNVIQ